MYGLTQHTKHLLYINDHRLFPPQKDSSLSSSCTLFDSAVGGKGRDDSGPIICKKHQQF